MNELVKIENNEIIIKQDFITKYKEFKKIQLEMDLLEKEFKEDLKNAMEQTSKQNIILDGFSASYKKSTIRTSIDAAKLKNELPEIYDAYSKTSEVSSSITLKCE